MLCTIFCLNSTSIHTYCGCSAKFSKVKYFILNNFQVRFNFLSFHCILQPFINKELWIWLFLLVIGTLLTIMDMFNGYVQLLYTTGPVQHISLCWHLTAFVQVKCFNSGMSVLTQTVGQAADVWQFWGWWQGSRGGDRTKSWQDGGQCQGFGGCWASEGCICTALACLLLLMAMSIRVPKFCASSWPPAPINIVSYSSILCYSGKCLLQKKGKGVERVVEMLKWQLLQN